jgi:hypothetical protein
MRLRCVTSTTNTFNAPYHTTACTAYILELLLLQDIEHGYPLVDTGDGSSSDGTNSDDEAADITISEYTSEASSRYGSTC